MKTCYVQLSPYDVSGGNNLNIAPTTPYNHSDIHSVSANKPIVRQPAAKTPRCPSIYTNSRLCSRSYIIRDKSLSLDTSNSPSLKLHVKPDLYSRRTHAPQMWHPNIIGDGATTACTPKRLHFRSVLPKVTWTCARNAPEST